MDRGSSDGATVVAEALLAWGERALEGLDGDLRARRGWLEQAYRAAERSGDSPAMARAALGLAGLWAHEHRAAAGRAELAAASAASAPGIALPGEVVGGEAMSCTRHGRDWLVTLGSRTVVVGQSIGLLHLAVLIANPRQEIPAIDLVAGVEAAAAGITRATGSAQPVLDRTAIREYRHRLSQLPGEIGELEARDDAPRAARARAEREWLIAALSGAGAIGDRTRRFTNDPERARIAVGKAIRRAITRITEADTVIGESLHGRVHTGIRCSYWPA